MRIYWAGEDESLQLVMQAQAKVEALQKQPGMTAGYVDEMIAKLPPIWRHEGNTAVVEVDGPVVAGAAGWMRLFGVLGYDDLAKAVIEAAMDPDTKNMLYHINTPGGDVDGIVDMCALLTQVSGMKPSAKHTTSLCASAGYWMASAITGTFTAGPTSVVGSIGVLQVHRENSKMMDDIGIKATVLRAGKYKAEVNSIEPLTPEAKARAESQLADVHALFRAQVAKGRPNLAAEDLNEVTEGQTFLGKRAVQAGLIDKITNFEQARKLLDTKKVPRDNLPNSKGNKAMAISLTPEQLNAIAAGAPLASFGLKADGSAMSAEEVSAYEAKVREEAAAKTAANTADKPAVVPGTQDGAGGQGAPPDAGVVALLKEQLTAANTKITELSVAATAHATVAAAHEGLLAIARGAAGNMLVALGGSRAAVDGMDGAAIVAEHARVTEQFKAKFPVGRQSAEQSDENKGEKAGAALPAGFLDAVKNAPKF